MKKKNKFNTTTSSGWIIFGIAWPVDLHDKILMLSKKKGVSKGELVRRIVRKVINNAKN